MKKITIIAIDPSGVYKNKKSTIGISKTVWKLNPDKRHMTVDNLISVSLNQMDSSTEDNLNIFYKTLETALQKEKVNHLIIEDYILYGDKVGPQLFQEQPTSQVIGAIKYIAMQNKTPTKLQRACEAKTYSNKVLEFPLWGYIKNKHILDVSIRGKRHAMDAFRHTVVFVQKLARKNYKE